MTAHLVNGRVWPRLSPTLSADGKGQAWDMGAGSDLTLPIPKHPEKHTYAHVFL